MKLQDIKKQTKDAADYLVQSLESGHSEVLTQFLGSMARFHTYIQLWRGDTDLLCESREVVQQSAAVILAAIAPKPVETQNRLDQSRVGFRLV